jgi:hypothetical protein
VKKAAPKIVVMLAFRGTQVLDIVGPMQMFAGANDAIHPAGPAHSLLLLAERKGPFKTNGGLRLVADGSYADLPRKIDSSWWRVERNQKA